MLKVGIAEVDITPGPGLPRAGMPNPQKGEGTAWPLMGRVFVFDDGLSQVAIITLDLLELTPQTVDEFRHAVIPGTQLQPNDVMITCTHTHWGPHTAAIMDEDTDFDYLDFVRVQLVQAMAQAWSQRQPAKMKVGSIQAPGWSFNRRPIYRTALGEQVGTQGPLWIPEFVRMEGPEDPELQVVLLESTQGQVMGGLVNFACHTTIGPDEPFYSADYPGPLTEQLSKTYGGIFGFIQGCAGNIWQMNLTAERHPIYQENGTAFTRRMGEALAAKAVEALTTAKYLDEVKIGTQHKTLPIPQRRPTLKQIEQAKWFLEKRPQDVDLKKHMLDIYGHEFTFYTDWGGTSKPEIQGSLIWQEEWFARGLIGIWEWQRRTGVRELVDKVEVQAISIGELAFVGFPAEYFVEFGLKTKQLSPFPHTIVSELANGCHGYVPTQEAFHHGGYETRLGDASRLVEEAGDWMFEAGIQLLQELWADRPPDHA